jgi:hypothetical protein
LKKAHVKISNDELERLARVGRLPESADLKKFRRAIRGIVRTYRSIRETPPQQVKSEVWALVVAVESKNRNDLNAAVKRLSTDVRDSLKGFDDHTLDAFGRKGSVARWRALLTRALVTSPRPPRPPRTTRRGRPRESAPVDLYNHARPRRGNPVCWPEWWLTAVIVGAWQDATGRTAPTVVNRGRDRVPIPVIALLAEVLKLVGYSGHTAAVLFAAWRKQLEPAPSGRILIFEVTDSIEEWRQAPAISATERNHGDTD